MQHAASMNPGRSPESNEAPKLSLGASILHISYDAARVLSGAGGVAYFDVMQRHTFRCWVRVRCPLRGVDSTPCNASDFNTPTKRVVPVTLPVGAIVYIQDGVSLPVRRTEFLK